MARKGITEAEAETRLAHEARLQYLSRNPGFRSAIESLAKLRDALPGKSGELTAERVQALLKFQADAERTAKVWSVPWDLLSQLSWHEWLEGRDHTERIPAAAVLADPLVVAWINTPSPQPDAPFGHLPTPTIPETRFLNLRVDLDHSVEALLPMIEKELGRYSRQHRHGRRRLKQVDFYLKVFDLAESGETFKAISSKLNKRPSTIKSAFISARRNSA